LGIPTVVDRLVQQPIGVPPATTENGLLAPGTGTTRRLRPHPAGLAPLISKKIIKKLPRRMGHARLAEKRTYPRFYIP